MIYNPSAGTAQRLEAMQESLGDVEMRQSRSPQEARQIAAGIDADQCDLVIAAGGDGTIHHVVNGLMAGRHRNRRPALGILPLGTGNDLARTLAIPPDPEAAIEILRRGQRRTIDLVKARIGRSSLWCINVSAGGFTGQMNEQLTDEMKQTWGPLAYLRGALKVLPDLKDYHTKIFYDTKAPAEIQALNVIIANGRTAGRGTVVAPLANPEDGLIDVVVVGQGSKLKLTGVVARLIAGNYLDSQIVSHRRARRVTVESHPGMWFNVDGELIGSGRATFQILPGALNVIVGPEYVASATKT